MHRDHLPLRGEQLDLRTTQKYRPPFSVRRLGEDMEVNTEQHERPEKQDQDEVQELT
jgi:hypothetical protein